MTAQGIFRTTEENGKEAVSRQERKSRGKRVEACTNSVWMKRISNDKHWLTRIQATAMVSQEAKGTKKDLAEAKH